MVFKAQVCLSPVATSPITPIDAGKNTSEGVDEVPPEINSVLELIRILSRFTLLFPPDEEDLSELHLKVCEPASKLKDADWNVDVAIPDHEPCNTSSI